jgi:hypothetical protein
MESSYPHMKYFATIIAIQVSRKIEEMHCSIVAANLNLWKLKESVSSAKEIESTLGTSTTAKCGTEKLQPPIRLVVKRFLRFS